VPQQTFDAAIRALKKGDVSPVYYLVGAEDLLKVDLVREISDRVLDPSLRDFNFDQRTATSLDPEELSTLLNTLPMMADRRVVVLRDVEGWQKKSRGRAELLRYLAKPAAETVLVLVQSAADPEPETELAKLAVTVHCATLPPERVLRWLAHRSGQLGITLPPEAAEHLLHAVGSDLTALDAELAKLASLAPGTPLTRELVGSLVGIHHGETIYDWRDAVLDDATGRALTLLRPVLDQSGISGVKLVSLLGTTLSGVALARAHHDKGTRGSALDGAIFRSLLASRPSGLPEWKAEAARWARWSERWPAPRLSAALRATLATDQVLKSTTLSNEPALLGELVMRLGISRQERVA
jgi:DNA polymerase-3 subunit delta